MKYILNFLSWTLFILYINLISPDTIYSHIIFFIIAFICFLSTTLVFIKKFRINLILSVYFVTLLILQYFQLLNPLNLALVAALSFLIYIAT